ncbi:hypothetical protein CHS0354_030863 [Potamilus streckersoni]|nr:hypothetical protein CHS0354_030863 [Potamilus streckersoni]
MQLTRQNGKLKQKVAQLKTQMRADKENWQLEGCKWKYKYEELEKKFNESSEHSYKSLTFRESSPDDNVQSKCAGDEEKKDIHEKEVLELKEKVVTLEEVLKTVQDEADNLSELKRKYERRNTQLLNRITLLEQSLQKAQTEKDARQGNDCPKSFGNKKTKIMMERDRLKNDNEKLRMRLSEIAGSLLLDRNPSIADLSDETRPSKLADSFSELYDNEWTDAFEEQEGSEKEAIQNLLNMLVEIHNKCQTVGSKYLLALEETSITLPGKGRKILEQTVQIPSTIRKFLLEIRKNFTPLIMQQLTKFFQGKFIGKTEESLKERQATSRYVEKCTQLCWYMATKDPPVVLGPIPSEEDIVNKDFFHLYTSSGKHVHFCVWPPLLLHNGGSLLRKGVIQGK